MTELRPSRQKGGSRSLMIELSSGAKPRVFLYSSLSYLLTANSFVIVSAGLSIPDPAVLQHCHIVSYRNGNAPSLIDTRS